MAERLTDLLDQIRTDLSPGDAVAICRDGAQHRCKRRCPGPGQAGSVCVIIEADDERSSHEIAAEIERSN